MAPGRQQGWSTGGKSVLPTAGGIKDTLVGAEVQNIFTFSPLNHKNTHTHMHDGIKQSIFVCLKWF